MALTPGTRFGPYEIAVQIGVGGMGEVYRAMDTKLKREVAVKVLPASLASDAGRLARFQREAEVLASLNHPNIAAIYGLEDADGSKALVMELVEGPTLADRIAQGAIPIDEALPIAKQIAEALEAAHEQGIIHRDLKPANVKVRPDGTVKVLDFGLAKALEPTSAMSPGMSQAPTITTPAMTQAGMILGTAAYMSPEQARGKTVDKRSDIWAFGCVLFEMLVGRRAFEDEDVSMTLSKVLQREPDFDALPAVVPAHVRQTLRLCLRKPLKERLPDIGAVRLALEGAFETGVLQTAESVAVPQPAVWRRPVPVALAASLLTAVVIGLVAWSLWPSAEPPVVTRSDYDLPEGQQFANTGGAVRLGALAGWPCVRLQRRGGPVSARDGGPGVPADSRDREWRSGYAVLLAGRPIRGVSRCRNDRDEAHRHQRRRVGGHLCGGASVWRQLVTGRHDPLWRGPGHSARLGKRRHAGTRDPGRGGRADGQPALAPRRGVGVVQRDDEHGCDSVGRGPDRGAVASDGRAHGRLAGWERRPLRAHGPSGLCRAGRAVRHGVRCGQPDRARWAGANGRRRAAGAYPRGEYRHR